MNPLTLRPYIMTGSYDGRVRIWNDQGEIIDSVDSKHAIKSVQWLSNQSIIIGDAQNNIYAYKVNMAD